MAAKALSGLRVVEYGELVTGPYCTKLLADMGAEVVKVEPLAGDPSRRLPPFFHDQIGQETSGLFLYLNGNKQGMTLDLCQSTGRALFQELIAEADILVTNSMPSEQDALGLTYEALKGVQPRLIVTSIAPFGRTGPYRDFKATELIVAMLSGVARHTPGQVTDPEREPPLKPGENLLGFMVGLQAAVATMGAVFFRLATGKGQQVDVSAQEAGTDTVRSAIANFTYAYEMQPRSVLERATATGVRQIPNWPCKDGFIRGIPPFPLDERRWGLFVDVMGHPAWVSDERFKDQESRNAHWDDLAPLIEAWSMQHTKDEITTEMQKRHIASMAVNDMADLARNVQLASRDYFVDIDHPAVGTLRVPGAPYKFSETPWSLARPAPLLGQHNEEILCQRLGHSRDELKWLTGAGVI